LRETRTVLASALGAAVLLMIGMCGVAEARTIYTVAGGGDLLPPEIGDRPVPGTAISLDESSGITALPNGDLLILSGGHTLVLDPQGMVRAVAPSPGPDLLGVDRSGTEYAYAPGSDQLVLRRPGGAYEPFASLHELLPFSPTDMLVHPDGGVLLASVRLVMRVMPDGTTVRVAGTGGPGHFMDGVPATEARLRYPTSLAWAVDGALLIADRDDNRVRRLDPHSGTISTVAGTGQRRSSGDGGLATAAPLDWPTWITVGPHSGYAVVELSNRSARIRRVSRTGIIRTVAGGGAGRSFGLGTSMLNGDGGVARRASLFDAGDLVLTPKDEYVFADDDLIRLVTSPRTVRLGLALRTALPGRRRVSYTLTVPARLRFEVRGDGGRLLRQRRARAGRGYFRLPAGLPAGGWILTLRATSSAGISVRKAGLITAPRLSRRVAAAAIQADDAGRPLITPRGLDTAIRRGDEIRPTRCRRFGPRRVDCVWALDISSDQDCDGISSARLDRHGQMYIGEYANGPGDECVGFQRRPRWEFEPRAMPMLGAGHSTSIKCMCGGLVQGTVQIAHRPRLYVGTEASTG
jgi:hypothetical protein